MQTNVDNVKIHPKLKEFFGHFYLAIEWRVIGTLVTLFIAYIISGDAKIAIGIASAEVIVKLIVQSLWLQYRVKIHHHKLITLENERNSKHDNN